MIIWSKIINLLQKENTRPAKITQSRMGLRGVVTKLGAKPFNFLYNQYDTRVKVVSNYVDRISSSFVLPERFKGTMVERWAEYWQAVYKDYKDVAVGIVTDVKDKPWKGVAWSSLIGSSYYCAKHNPDEHSYRNALLQCSNDFIFVGQPIRNPKTTRHLNTVEHYYNQGIIKRQSFGLFSLMWVDNFKDTVGLYKATCRYLAPEILTFHTRIVDVGFLDRWWLLEKKMIDCDVNPEEWDEEPS